MRGGARAAIAYLHGVPGNNTRLAYLPEESRALLKGLEPMVTELIGGEAETRKKLRPLLDQIAKCSR